MKKTLVVAICLLVVCCLFASCSANMSTPNWGRNDQIRDYFTQEPNNGGNAKDGTGSGDRNANVGAGDYIADENGRVRGYNSDNDNGW